MEQIWTTEDIARLIRSAGYRCEPYTSPDILYVSAFPPKEIPEGDWYLTDCPLEHGKEVIGLVLQGSLVCRADDVQKKREEAWAAHHAHLARLRAV